MKWIVIVVMMSLSLISWGDDSNIDPPMTHAQPNTFKHARELFSQGKYQGVIDDINKTLKKAKNKLPKESRGFAYYWKGICYNRLQNFSKAIKEFRKAIKINYSPNDIHYEYGQALFALDKLDQASTQFKKSVNKKFKMAVSSYYLGYISKEKGNRKKAFLEFRKINRLDDVEVKDVLQASEMQIGDMYLEQLRKRKNPLIAIRDQVIPQYKKALKIDENSSLAPKIAEKIKVLQKKYDLILFQLSNGRLALNPPYFLRLATEIGHDSNVTFSPAESSIEKSKQSSFYAKIDTIGRYTFYPQNFISLSPELRFNQTRYFNRVPEIYKNDNYLIAPALRTAYEHSLWSRPASVLVDYDYSKANRDVHEKQKLEYSSQSHTTMIGERFNFFESGETIVRFRHMQYQSYIDALDFRTNSIVVEQLKSMKFGTLVLIAGHDQRRADTPATDTDSYSLRTDLLLNRVRDLFTPSFGLGLTTIDPIRNRINRGREYLINPNFKLSKIFLKKWRSTFKYDYSEYQSKEKDIFAYKKSTMSIDLEYIF